MSSSEYRIAMPSMSTGRVLRRRRRLRQPHLQPGARRQPVRFPACTPSSSTPPSSARAAAALRDKSQQPGQSGVDPHAGQPLRDRHRAISRFAAHSRRLWRRPTASKSNPKTDSTTSRIAPPTDRRVGDVEHRPPAHRQEVHDVPRSGRATGRSGRPGCPSRRRESCPAHRPPRRHQPPAHPENADHHAGRDQRQHPGVSGGHRERRPRIADQVQVTKSPMIDTG